MSRRKDHTLFLEQRSYRRRRLQDAALLLPVLGGVLVLLPLVGPGAGSTRIAGVYFFILWFALVVLGAALSRRLMRDAAADSDSETDTDAAETGEPG